jgi:hypothetical protein
MLQLTGQFSIGHNEVDAGAHSCCKLLTFLMTCMSYTIDPGTVKISNQGLDRKTFDDKLRIATSPPKKAPGLSKTSTPCPSFSRPDLSRTLHIRSSSKIKILIAFGPPG